MQPQTDGHTTFFARLHFFPYFLSTLPHEWGCTWDTLQAVTWHVKLLVAKTTNLSCWCCCCSRPPDELSWVNYPVCGKVPSSWICDQYKSRSLNHLCGMLFAMPAIASDVTVVWSACPFTRSTNRQTNIEQLEHTSCTCILLDVCSMIARCLLDRVNGVLCTLLKPLDKTGCRLAETLKHST